MRRFYNIVHNHHLSFSRDKGLSLIHIFYPFSSELKNMATILRDGGNDFVYTKGSPEKIISMCRMDPRQRAEIERRMAGFQEKARRVIGFAHRKLPAGAHYIGDYIKDREKIEEDMTFDGFVAITDPLRKDVYESVRKCKAAGCLLYTSFKLLGDPLFLCLFLFC